MRASIGGRSRMRLTPLVAMRDRWSHERACHNCHDGWLGGCVRAVGRSARSGAVPTPDQRGCDGRCAQPETADQPDAVALPTRRPGEDQAAGPPGLSVPALSFALSGALPTSNIPGPNGKRRMRRRLRHRASPERHRDRAADALPLGAGLNFRHPFDFGAIAMLARFCPRLGREPRRSCRVGSAGRR